MAEAPADCGKEGGTNGSTRVFPASVGCDSLLASLGDADDESSEMMVRSEQEELRRFAPAK